VAALNAGADVDHEDAQMGTPLVVAISMWTMKKEHFVKRLLAAGADVNKSSRIQRAKPSKLTLKWRDEFLKDNLLKDDVGFMKFVRKSDKVVHYTTPLVAAVSRNDPRMVTLLLKAGADVNAIGGSTTFRRSALCSAVAVGGECVKILLEAGAEVNSTKKYMSPLAMACTHCGGQPGIVKMLLRFGATIGLDIDMVCDVGNLTCWEEVLKSGNMSPEATARTLCAALKAERLELVNALLTKGPHGRDHAALAIVMGLGATKAGGRQNSSQARAGPHTSERRRCRIGLLRLSRSVLMVVLGMLSLSEKGADPNVGCDQRTPLQHAMLGYHHDFSGHMGAVQALLKAGADVNLCGSQSTTALMEGSHEGNLDAVKAFIEAGADLEKTNTETGYTALYYAIHGGNVEVLKALLEAGANCAKGNGQSPGTPLWLANTLGRVDMVPFLE
jgi:ankyrin repeat protein